MSSKFAAAFGAEFPPCATFPLTNKQVHVQISSSLCSALKFILILKRAALLLATSLRLLFLKPHWEFSPRVFPFPVRASRCYSCAVFSFRMCQDLIPPLLFFKKKAKWQLRWIEVNTWKAQSMNDTDTILSFFFHHPLFENDHPLTSKLKSKRIFFIFYKWALGLFAVAMLPACLSPSM